MRSFEYLTPRSLDEALHLLDPGDPDVRPSSGGTALMLMMKAGVLRPARLVSLRHLETEHQQICITPEGELQIGGMTTLAVLEHHPGIAQGWPALSRAFKTLANVRVRNAAMIGGNLAHGDPHMDMPPVLTMLGARIEIQGPRGKRVLPIAELFQGYYETALARDELITRVIVPPLGSAKAAYLKVTTRAAHDWPALGVAACVQEQDGMLSQARLVVGAATDRPTRLLEAEQALIGKPLTDAMLKAAGEQAAHALDIVSDQHGSAGYKKHLLSVYLGRAVRAALDGKQHGEQ
jgi:carbon-monoxide dehydrogenase medium subunit